MTPQTALLASRADRIRHARAWSMSIFDAAADALPSPPPTAFVWRCPVCRGTEAYIKKAKYRECVACKREASKRNWRARNARKVGTK